MDEAARDAPAREHDVTVVMPTHRRPAALRRAIAGLRAQETSTFEWDLVVVDNDTAPGSVDAIRSELDHMPVPSRVVLETTLGASNARNRGIAEASGRIVAFIDDDVVPDPRWLATLVEPILDGRCEAVGGRVELDPQVPRPRWLAPWLLPYLAEFDLGEAEADLRDLSAGVLSEPYLLTANAAFQRDVLVRIGGLDPRLGPREGVPFVNDDLSLCRKVLGTGARVHYVPRARVEHELPEGRLTRRYLARRLYAQGRSDWLLDEDRWMSTTTKGVRGATLDFVVGLVRRARRGQLLSPSHTFVWAETARDLGLLREALTHVRARRAA